MLSATNVNYPGPRHKVTQVNLLLYCIYTAKWARVHKHPKTQAKEFGLKA
jgi:hypothetical protein